MLSIIYHKAFVKEFKKLPKEIKEKAVSLEKYFKSNPFDPHLHSKALAGELKDCYSFRITREYRIIFTFTSKDEVLFLKVGHRKNIYR